MLRAHGPRNWKATNARRNYGTAITFEVWCAAPLARHPRVVRRRGIRAIRAVANTEFLRALFVEPRGILYRAIEQTVLSRKPLLLTSVRWRSLFSSGRGPTICRLELLPVSFHQRRVNGGNNMAINEQK